MVKPEISFIVASYNARTFLGASVQSALAQRGVSVEVLIVDDCSSDDSLELGQALADADPRVRIFQTPRNLGPAGARNIGLAHARGDWIAILDSDDLLHPERSARLLTEAKAYDADMIADDLLLFDDETLSDPRFFLDRRRAKKPDWISLPDYLNETQMFGPRPNLGFLKPYIRLDRLRAQDIRYDESLKIAEDDALVLALLRGGAKYRLLPEPLYFYRKHGASISHRLSIENVDRMRAAGDRLCGTLADDPVARHALKPRDRALHRTRAFTYLIAALKDGKWGDALRLIVSNPPILLMMRMPLAGAFRKIGRRLHPPTRVAPKANPRSVLFLSRQRLIGATNGSSAYLLAIADAVRGMGLVPHLLQPSPAVLGRTPFYALAPEMDVFETISIRGTVRIGRWVIAKDPRIGLAAARGVIAGLLRRIGVRHRFVEDRKFPPSISAPWQREDLLAVAQWARHRPGVAIADYLFQVHALPYLLDPSLRTATVMHDLFHARVGQFASGSDSVASLAADQEIAMLSGADAVLAIQSSEAAFVACNIPSTRSILVQMPAKPVAEPQTGDRNKLLFVGSNAAPNSLGLQWFLDKVWPSIRTASPQTELIVAGTVNRAFGGEYDGVHFAGLVNDLAECYAEAGIVISPLIQGSGLKIKLIEALAHGKACVVTSVTLQGVEDELSNAVALADDPEDFAAEILRLQKDDAARGMLATAALAAASNHFGADTCMAEFRSWLQE